MTEPGGEPGPELELTLLVATEMGDVRLAALRRWLGEMVTEVAAEAAPRTFAVRFVDDREMQALNARFRGRDRTTDVLSFAGEDGPEGRHLGDVAISVPVARTQARENGLGLDQELRRLLLHGVLHCLGHDHETDGGEMERLEERLRARWLGRDVVGVSA